MTPERVSEIRQELALHDKRFDGLYHIVNDKIRAAPITVVELLELLDAYK